MTITWLGHSCFVLESGGFRVLLDPYKVVRGYPDVTAEVDAVYCSHGHFDHAYTAGVTLAAGRADPFAVKEVPTFHDDQNGSFRGANTARVFSAEGLTVAHLGDLGHPLTERQAAAIGPCDVLMLPVGGTYTIDAQTAKEVAEQLAPRIIIPMHYRQGEKGFLELDTVDTFLSLFPREMIRRYPVSRLEVTKDTPAQVAVLAVP